MRNAIITTMLLLGLVTPAPANEPIVEIPGSLMIVGGGSMPGVVRDRFVELAGGKDAKIVVIPTASTDAGRNPESFLRPWQEYMPASLSILHTTDRDEADSDTFVAPLREATGVWFSGGIQSRITASYRGTRTEKALHAVLERKGVIGGTSAGAAIMSDLMITGGRRFPETAPGLGFLPGFVVDQHFLARDRVNRSLRVLEQHPGRVALGIDESTAVEVSGRRLRVIGESYAVVILGAGNRRGISVSVLKSSGTADLFQLRRAARDRAGEAFPPEKPRPPVVEKGSLVIGGGGGMPANVWKRFLDLAGGPDKPIVIIPTAQEDPVPRDPIEARIFCNLGAKDIRILHTRDREQANDPKFVEPIKEAGGVWFGGGRQWRFVDAYEGTLTEKEIRAVLERGGVIGGSSAGASIQSEYMPRGHPLGNLEVMAEGYERGFGYLPGCGVDQHFFERKREPDMDDMMRTFPNILGIGLGEGSAIIVQGSEAEVVGRGRAAFYDALAPMVKIVILEPGSRYSLTERRLVEPVE